MRQRETKSERREIEKKENRERQRERSEAVDKRET